MAIARMGDVDKRLSYVNTPRLRLEWAADYVQTDLGRLPLWRLEELRADLCLFVGFSIGVSADDEDVELPSDAEMLETQAALSALIYNIIAREPAEVGGYRAELRIVFLPRLAAGPEDLDVERPLEPHLIESGKHDMSLPDLARWQLGKDVVDEARRRITLKACPGPIPRRRGPVCGRWFVGPEKKQYCSPPCQSRAVDRRRRSGHT